MLQFIGLQRVRPDLATEQQNGIMDNPSTSVSYHVSEVYYLLPV